MKGIYYDGSVEGQSVLARAARAAIPHTEGHVRLRDAHAWAQQPAQGIEKFDSVVIPTGEAFDDLAGLYADAGTEVFRDDLQPAPVIAPPVIDPVPSTTEAAPAVVEPVTEPMPEPAVAPAPKAKGKPA